MGSYIFGGSRGVLVGVESRRYRLDFFLFRRGKVYRVYKGKGYRDYSRWIVGCGGSGIISGGFRYIGFGRGSRVLLVVGERFIVFCFFVRRERE